MPLPSDPIARVLRFAPHAAALAAVLWVTGALLAGRPPPRTNLLPALEQAPIQTPTDLAPFTFSYRGHGYEVEPVADYELWGLVMSRNNPRSLADSYHDRDSVDTRDLCVVWGPNLALPLEQVSVKNSSWTCWVRWPAGVDFDMTALSNNHLVTDSEAIRSRIETVMPGDQVHLRGFLVNYAPSEHPQWLRRSSTRRDDSGNTACEVFFVDELEVLRRGTPVAWALRRSGGWGLLAALCLWAGLSLRAVAAKR